MKHLMVLIIVCLFAFGANGQKIALLDKVFKQPILFTDSLTVQQVKKNYFPIGSKDFDTLYANLTYIEEMLSKRQRAKMESFELRAGNTRMKIERVPMAYGDRYRIVFNTSINEVNSVYTFSNGEDGNKDVVENVKKLKKYMKTNQSLFTAPYEIHPKVYNIVVISD